MYKGKVTDELREIYQSARAEGIWLREFSPAQEGGVYMAAAGSIKKLEEIEERNGQEIDVSKLALGDIMGISIPGNGKTREEACRTAIEEFKDYEKGKNENETELYASFEEKGYKIEAYIPRNDQQPLEFVVRAYKGEELVEEMKVPMIHRPIFGVDVGDIATLEEKTDELLKRLP